MIELMRDTNLNKVDREEMQGELDLFCSVLNIEFSSCFYFILFYSGSRRRPCSDKARPNYKVGPNYARVLSKRFFRLSSN